MSEENKKEVHKKLLTDLESSDKEVILKSIISLREEGVISDIPVLLDLLLENNDPEIERTIRNLLIDIKDNKATESIMAAIQDKKYATLRKDLVAVCWESRLSFNEYLDVFVDILIHDEYLTAFEAFTVIENMSGKISQEEKDKQTEKLKTAIATVPEERKGFLHEAMHLVQEISDQKEY